MEGCVLKNLFEQDGAIVKYANLFVNLLFVSVLWILTSLPVITIGTSMSALFATVHQTIREGEGYVSKTYFGAFRKYFKSTFPVWLLKLCMLAVLAVDLWYFRRALIAGRTEGTFLILMLFLLVFVSGWILTDAYIKTREECNGIGIKASLVLCAGKMHWTIGIALLSLAAGVLIYIMPLLIFLVPGLLFTGLDFALERMILS